LTVLQIAAWLRHLRPATFVALLLDEGPFVVLSELAVMKAGAAFAPFDPGHPGDQTFGDVAHHQN
jgi:non-ribosomal peptide synthetase component F